MPGEHAMLRNVELRKERLGDASLIINHAIFSASMQELICENTQFNHCDFIGDVILDVKSFTNVTFSNCTIRDSKIGSGTWHNVRFESCHAQGNFKIVGDEHSEDVAFIKCVFTGSTPRAGSNPDDSYGSAGTLGSAAFDNCDMTYMRIHGQAGLSIKDSRLNKVDAVSQRGNGMLKLDNVDVKDYLDLSSGKFSLIQMKNVRFEYIDLEGVETGILNIEESYGHFSGKLLVAKQMLVRSCTFEANGNPHDPSERKGAGFNILYAKIASLAVEDVKFIGSNGSLFLGGAVNLAYDKDEPRYGDPVGYSSYGKLSIKNTSLKGAFFSYLKASELYIDHCDIENADFMDSHIDKMEITGSTFSGKTDFSGTVINHCNVTDNIRKLDAKINLDKNKLVTI